jgi:hypothetical protein
MRTLIDAKRAASQAAAAAQLESEVGAQDSESAMSEPELEPEASSRSAGDNAAAADNDYERAAANGFAIPRLRGVSKDVADEIRRIEGRHDPLAVRGDEDGVSCALCDKPYQWKRWYEHARKSHHRER